MELFAMTMLPMAARGYSLAGGGLGGGILISIVAKMLGERRPQEF